MTNNVLKQKNKSDNVGYTMESKLNGTEFNSYIKGTKTNVKT